MKEMIVLLLFGMLLFSGCTQEQEQASAAKEVAKTTEADVSNTQNQEEAPEEVAVEPTVAPQEESPAYSSVAHSQEDCSVLTPNCESCLAKKNCGWCKESNSCHFGDESGSASAPCKESEWAYDIDSCSVIDEGESCSDLTNCVACLSGTGCQWCIEGSVCAPEGTTQKCLNDKWLSESYECNYASR